MGRYYVLRFFMQRLQNALFKIFVKFLRFCLEWTSGPNRRRPLSIQLQQPINYKLAVYSTLRLKKRAKFDRRKVDKKSKPTRKLKHANCILESFEYSAKCHLQNRFL